MLLTEEQLENEYYMNKEPIISGEPIKKSCNNNLEPEIMNMFYQNCSEIKLEGACKTRRSALICETYYLIVESSSSFGSKFYGPFLIE